MKRIQTSILFLLLLLTFAALLPVSAQQAKKPTETPPLKPVVKLGEIRIRLFGFTTQQMACNFPARFQLFQSGIPVLNGWPETHKSRPDAMGALGDIRWYSEGDTFYIKGLKSGVYDLHFQTNDSRCDPQIRPVHIYGIVVPTGNSIILDDLRFEKGDTVYEIGKPTILPDPAVNIVDKFNELLRQFTDQSRQVEQLRRDNAAITRRVEELERAIATLQQKKP